MRELAYTRPTADVPLAATLLGAFVVAVTLTVADTTATTTSWIAHAVLAGLVGASMLTYLHETGGRLRRRREHLALFGWVILGIASARALIEFVALPLAILPVAAFVVPIARQLDRTTAVVVGGALAVLCGALDAFDATSTTLFACQAIVLVGALRAPRRSAWQWTWGVAMLVALAGAAWMAALHLLDAGGWPRFDDTVLERSGVVAAAAGGGASVIVGVVLDPLFERIVGNLRQSQLVELSDLSRPLLQRIAKRAPGTWQHSRMMANLAEAAAHAVGADALLVRVGAYYHDLGKADEPRYFIENTATGETNAHELEQLMPAESAQRIIAHVREGVRRGRASGVPEAIIDFMHTHHGTSRVEYFWQRALREANERGLPPPDEYAFRYPGDVPRTRETGILAIVDAIEAAARTLRSPSRSQIENVVKQIMFTKLYDGQLDESGLSARDLRRIAENLVEALVGASHSRVTYPWQEQEGHAEATAQAGSVRLRLDASNAHVPVDDAHTASLRVVRVEPRRGHPGDDEGSAEES